MKLIQNIQTNMKSIYSNIDIDKYMCGTVSSMLSGLETRFLGLNTLGKTLSQSVQVGRTSTASWV